MANDPINITDAQMRHYLAKGRQERSKAAHGLFSALSQKLHDIFSGGTSGQLSHG